MLRPFILAAIAATAGCASISEDDCLATDWQATGYNNASRGFDRNAVGALADRCAKLGVAADLAAYDIGYSRGLPVYCVAGNGFEAGAAGAPFAPQCQPFDAYLAGYDSGLEGFCSPQSGFAFAADGGLYDGQCSRFDEHGFLVAYREGRVLFDYKAAVSAAESDLAGVESALDNAHRRREKFAAKLAGFAGDPAVDSEDVIKFTRKLADAQSDIRILKDDRRAARRNLRLAVRDLEAYYDRESFHRFGGAVTPITVNIDIHADDDR